MYSDYLKRFASISSMDLVCDARLDYATGCGTIQGKQISPLQDILTGISTRVPPEQTPFSMRFCLDNNWILRKDESGVYHVYNILNQYIGEIEIARVLNTMGIIDPQLAVQPTTSGTTPAIHTVCTVGYSEVLNKWAVWGFGSMQTADSFEQACEYSGLNSTVSLRSTMELKAKLLNMINYSDYLNIHDQKSTTPNPYFADYEPTPSVNIGGADYNNSKGLDGSHENSCKRYTSCVDEAVPTGLMGSENNIESPENSINTKYVGPVGIISGEHRQHNVYGPSRKAKSAMPQSGDHRQHNIPKVNANPGAYRPRVEGHASESATKENVLAYDWYRYAPASGRSKHFRDHHKTYDLSIEAKEVFGVLLTKTGYNLLMADNTAIKFKMTMKEVDTLIKNSKPFKGKIDGISLALKIKAEADEVTSGKTVIVKHGDFEKPKYEGNVYLGIIQASQFKDDMTVLISDSERSLAANLKKRVLELKAAVPSAIIVQLAATNPFVQRVIAKPNQRFKRAVVDSAIKGHNIRNLTFTSKMQQYTQKPKQPSVGFKRNVPLFSGVAKEVMVEIKKGFIQGYFSSEFKPASLKKTSVTLDSDPLIHSSIIESADKPIRMTLCCQNTSPLFVQEAKYTIERVQEVYGNHIRGKVSTVEINGAFYTMVVLALYFKKRPDEVTKRCRKLYDMVNNNFQAESIRNRLNKITETTADIDRQLRRGDEGLTLLEQAALSQRREALERMQKELEEATSDYLVMNAPVYAIKSGQSFITVEVVDVDIAEGRIFVRAVRGKNEKEITEKLWTYSGKSII